MNTRHRWIIAVGALLLAAAVGYAAYTAGFSQGIEESGKVAAAPQSWHGHHHHWGFGWVFPLFIFAFWLVAFRAFRGHHHPCRYDENHPRG